MVKFGSFSQRVSLKRLLVCFVALFGFSLSVASDNEREREKERERERITSIITLASNADVQKQIEALKQENELLELQQKNEALKRRESSAEIAEQIDAIKAENEALKAKKAENNKIIKKGFLGFCRGKYSPTGCFIGGELGLAITDNWFWLDYKYIMVGGTFPLSKNTTSVNPILNLTFGYQWYYMQSQGIRIKANVGYANYYTTFKNFVESIDVDKNTNAIQYGLELAWLWDFVRKGKHTLGIDLGTGFEGSTFFGKTIRKIEGSKFSDDLDNFTSFTYVIRTGLHYYFNVNHQIGLAYAYKGSYTAVDGQKQNLGKFSTSPRNQILLSYAYKF